MNEDFYIQLIHKQITGDISLEEQIQLDEFVAMDPRGPTLVEEIELSWTLSQDESAIPNINVNQELKAVRQKLNLNKSEVSVVPLRSNSLRIAAAVLVLITAGAFLFRNEIMDQSETITIAAADANEHITLPDGTQVWLQTGAEIQYKDSYNEDNRNVVLHGTAFFDVNRNEDLAFEIAAGEANVTVLGTSFQVNQEQKATHVHVYTGRVSLSAIDQEKILTKGQSALYNPENQRIETIPHQGQEELVWKTGRFVFRDLPLELVVERIAQYNQANISLEKESLKDCPVNAVIQSTITVDVLNRLGRSFEMEVVKIDDSTYVLKGGRCQ